MRIDSLITNARVHTMVDEAPKARSIAIHNGTVVALDEEAESLDARESVDLGGATVVPGFNDVHHHVSHQGERLRLIDASAATSVEDVLSLVAEAATTRPPGGWIELTNFSQATAGRFPTRHELDAAGGERPVWMMHTSGHLGVASSAALSAGGIDVNMPPAVEGGLVETSAEGVATGLLTERAMALVTRMLKPRSLEAWADCIELGSRSAVARGVTSATDTGVIGPGLSGNGPVDIGSYQLALERGGLDVRMTLMPEWTSFADLGEIDGEEFRGLTGGIRTGFGDDHIRIGAVKFFADGSLLGQTAAVSEPFCSNGSYGDFVSDRDRMRTGMLAAHRYGWQLATHAIGDRAIDFVLDVYEEAHREYPRANTRHRIEHTAICGNAAADRIARGGFVPVPQAHFIGAFGDAMWDALGDERSRICYRQRSFLDRGITIPGSSDCPVVDGSPLLGIHDLVNRRTASGRVLGPQERLTPRQALAAYTTGSAYAQHQESRLGRIAPGYLADLVVLSRDLLDVPADEIADIQVELTMIGGRVVYERSS